MYPMKFDDMALFVAAIDAGSLSGGARATGVSLASASRHLAALERRLGVRLAVRTSRTLVPTDAGRAYHDKARRLLAEVDELEKGLGGEAGEPSGLLRITAPTLFGRAFLLPVAAAFLRRHSDIVVDVALLDREVDLTAENVHVAIVVGEPRSQGLMARRLGDIRWLLCASPDYLAARGTPHSPDDLAGHDRLVYSRDGRASRWRLPGEAFLPLPEGKVRLRANTIDAVIAAARAGCGIGLVPAWAVQPLVEAGELVTVLEDCTPAGRAVYALFTHRDMLAEKVRAFIDFTADRLAAGPWA